MLELYIRPLSEIPIKMISSSDQKPLIELVESIIGIKQSDDYLQNVQNHKQIETLKSEIDQLVYKLYNLTPQEIKIVEGKDENTD